MRNVQHPAEDPILPAEDVTITPLGGPWAPNNFTEVE